MCMYVCMSISILVPNFLVHVIVIITRFSRWKTFFFNSTFMCSPYPKLGQSFNISLIKMNLKLKRFHYKIGVNKI